MKFGPNLPQYMTDVLAGTDLGFHPQGQPQAQEGVGNRSLEALQSIVLNLNMFFGILFIILAP